MPSTTRIRLVLVPMSDAWKALAYQAFLSMEKRSMEGRRCNGTNKPGYTVGYVSGVIRRVHPGCPFDAEIVLLEMASSDIKYQFC